jgi:3-dehydroquinate synthase
MTDLHSQKLTLTLQYPVLFTRGLFIDKDARVAPLLEPTRRKLLVFVDDNVAACWPHLPQWLVDWTGRLSDYLELTTVETVPGGETIKNDPAIVERIAELTRQQGLCRHSYAMAIGGGAVLDAVGFAVSIVHRGLRLIRVPTTVLSQNDSGVGVKNGVNRFGVKNFYGVFIPPFAVLNDLDFLTTLDDRTWRSGVAEAFKVGIVRDAGLLERLIADVPRLRQREREAEEYMVRRTAALHLEHIARGGDPYEFGNSRPLDFGHWAAHRLESLSNFHLLHGEAVAIGMAIDLHCAADRGFIAAEQARRICTALRDLGLPIYHPLLDTDFDAVLQGLEEFREHLGGQLTLAMPCPLGTKKDIFELPRDAVRRAVAAVRELGSHR